MERIKSKQEIDSIFRTGTRQRHALLNLLITTQEQRGQFGRVAFIAGKKTGGAVERNKAKRMLREAYRLSPYKPQCDLVLLATHKTKSAKLSSLMQAYNLLLKRAGLGE